MGEEQDYVGFHAAQAEIGFGEENSRCHRPGQEGECELVLEGTEFVFACFCNSDVLYFFESSRKSSKKSGSMTLWMFSMLV